MAQLGASQQLLLTQLLQQNPALIPVVLQRLQQQQAQQAQAQQPRPGKAIGQGLRKLADGYLGKEAATEVVSSSAPEVVGSAPGKFGLPGKLMSDGTVATNYSHLASYVPPLAAVAYGGKTAYDFAKGDRLSTPQKLAMALPTAGLSLVSDKIQDATGLSHKSTKDYQRERLDKVKKNTKGWGKMLEQGRATAEANNNTWQDGKYAGQKWSWDKALDLAKEDPTHFQGVLGNAEVFGDDYFSLNDSQQKDLVSRLIKEDAYVSDKGDILIHKDKQNRARELFSEVSSGGIKDNGRVPSRKEEFEEAGIIFKEAPKEDSRMATKPDSRESNQQVRIQERPKQTSRVDLNKAAERGGLTPNVDASWGSSGTKIPRANNNPVADRYGAEVAAQVAAAQASGRNVGTGGAGYEWDGKNFIRRR